MPDSLTIKQISRAELFEVFKSEKLVRLMEALLTTVSETLPADTTALEAELDAHIADPADAHQASAIGFTPSGGLVSNNVQAGITEVYATQVPTTRTVNGHALSANVTVTAGDVGADASGTAASVMAAHNAAGDPHPQYALDTDLAGFVPVTRTVNGHALSANVTVTAGDVGLGSVTNDAQTKSSIVPNTVPAAGQLLVGNAGSTAYAPVNSSGDVTVSSTGVFTIGAKKVTYAQMQDVSAASKLLGRGAGAGSGAAQEITIGSGLTMTGTTLSVADPSFSPGSFTVATETANLRGSTLTLNAADVVTIDGTGELTLIG